MSAAENYYEDCENILQCKSFQNKHYTSISFYKKLGLRLAYINLNVKESDRTPILS